ncbi:P-loop containing nucleoside triphosphate hydrolase protein, partial [Chytridium lagenaria]
MAERVRPYQGVSDALAQAQFAERKWVWVADKEEGFLAGWITKEEGDKVTVQFSNNTSKTLHINDTEKMNPPKFDKVEDMADLTYLNEASTYSGLFLVTVNPYKRLPIYTDEVVKAYRNKKRNEMAPHIYAIADAAYHDMLQDKENQSILITGESGAGKTENTKKVIQYLASVATSAEKGKLGTLEQQILQANPILESFGNAQTIRNNNSSRFGKFIRLEFNPSGQICGANIERYLLEKSRVTHQTSKERNYHIFYQLLRGASPELKAKLLLDGTLNDYNFTKNSKKDIEGVDDAADFRLLQDSFNIMKLSSDEQNELYKIIAAVLHLGNIQVSGDRDDQAHLTEVGQSVCEKVCHVLGIPVAEFVKGLLKPKIKAGRDWVTQSRNVEQVQYSVEALSRTLYERMFGRLVDRINETLYVPSSKSAFIGVLDIAGFEIFDKNSFEQLCINYTNEKLQQFFNHHMFIIEQEEYRKEGIEWKFIDFGLDLQPTIELIEKTSPIGILSCLDEECVMPKANDKTFIDKLNGLWKGKSSKYEHYAGKVEYDTTGWLDKNKDPLNENITRLLAYSTEKSVANLFADYSGEQEDLGAKGRGITKKGAFRTVAQRHKEQLNSLMAQLYSTEPHFVRCIIPNEEKKAGKFQVNQVLEQLRCNGVLEGIRICRAGFPNRLTFMDFRQRYEVLAPGVIPKGFMDGRSGAQLLLESLTLDKNQYRVGTSKVFFRSGVLAQLEELRDVKLAKIVVKIQAIARGYLARKQYKKKLDQFRAIRIIQRNARIYVTLREWTLLNVTRTDEELRKREELAKEWEEKAKREIDERAKLEALRNSLEVEKKRIEDLLIQEKNAAAYQAELLSRTQKREVDLSEQLSALSSELEAKEVEYDNIVKTKKRLESDLKKKIEKEKLAREQKIRELEDDIRREAESFSRLDNEKKNLEKQLQDMQGNFDSASDQVTDVLRIQAKLKATITELEQKLENETLENKRIDSQRQAFESECGKLNASLSDLAKSRAELESVLKRKESELASVNDRLKQEISEREAVDKQRREGQLQLNATKGDLENERIEKERLLKSKKKLEEELDALSRLAEEKTSEESKQGELRRIREAEVNDLKSQLATALADAEIQRKTLGLNIDKLKVELDTVRGELLSSNKAKSNVERQVEDLKSEIERIEEARNKSEKAKKQAESDLSSSRSRVDELETALAELKIVKEALEVKVTSLGSKLEESEANASRFEREKQALARQVDTLRDEVEEEVKKSSSLESQKKKL